MGTLVGGHSLEELAGIGGHPQDSQGGGSFHTSSVQRSGLMPDGSGGQNLHVEEHPNTLMGASGVASSRDFSGDYGVTGKGGTAFASPSDKARFNSDRATGPNSDIDESVNMMPVDPSYGRALGATALDETPTMAGMRQSNNEKSAQNMRMGR